MYAQGFPICSLSKELWKHTAQYQELSFNSFNLHWMLVLAGDPHNFTSYHHVEEHYRLGYNAM
jgi:hypothetical protein